MCLLVMLTSFSKFRFYLKHCSETHPAKMGNFFTFSALWVLSFLVFFSILGTNTMNNKKTAAALWCLMVSFCYLRKVTIILEKYYHQALKDKRKLHLIIQYTDPYPTLTSDKRLR